MKKQFKKILDIKKFELDIAELDLHKKDIEIKKTEDNLARMRDFKIDSNISAEIKSNPYMLQQNYKMFNYTKGLLLKLNNERNLLNNVLKVCYIEVEKFEHLYKEEIKKEKIAIDRKEQKFLDDIAVMTFKKEQSI